MSIAVLLIALITVPASNGGSAEPIMLDFSATWCGPCQQMRPVVEQLIQKGYPIKPVDVDEAPDLKEQYQITGVPAFIVIDPKSGRVLARTEGAQPASQLAAFYNEARAKFAPRRSVAVAEEEGDEKDEEADTEARDETEGRRAREEAPTPTNPRPWETVVRIKVQGNGSIGFGSGTIIHSSEKESIILTCAHIFKMDGRRQATPDKFPMPISVDLFDGVLSGPKKNQVHYTRETFVGKAIDYDFSRDVGLIRIKPGRRLPYARVVPPHWTPKAGMGMITVGCSEGHDATAWNTVVVNPQMKGLAGQATYEAIECMVAPKQGRSGGGLFTSDGYIAGVCDFAEPRGNHGLYAHPQSIYAILDRNQMVAFYNPEVAPTRRAGGALLASDQPRAGRTAPAIARGQSPEPVDPGGVSLPPPDMFGIKTPKLADAGNPAARNRRATASRGGDGWRAHPVDIKLDRASDPDTFGPAAEATAETPVEDEHAPLPAPRPISSGKWRRVNKPLPVFSLNDEK